MGWPDELYSGIPIIPAETAWLIERDNGGLEYANGRGWTRDHRDALRFPAEADARRFAERAYKIIWTGAEAACFDWQDFTRIAEHRWGL